MATVGEQVGESARAFAAVFRNPALRRINLALAASVIGDWAYVVAVSVWAYEQGGATALGLFGVARYVAMAVLGPFVATAADRFPKRRVMICSDVARAATVAVAAAVIAARRADGSRVRAGLVTAVLSLAFRPAQASLLPRLATEHAS